jgi:plastocyanin
VYSNRTRKTARIVLSVVLAIAVLGSLVGCGDGTDAKAAAAGTSKPTTTTTEAEATETGPFHVTAKEFAFSGLPKRVAAGKHTFTFTNAGKESHELVIFKNPKGLTPEELFALGPEGSKTAVELAGMVMAGPGEDAEEAIEADLSAGTYEVICFIPTPVDGKPHFSHGMHTTIEVA